MWNKSPSARGDARDRATRALRGVLSERFATAGVRTTPFDAPCPAGYYRRGKRGHALFFQLGNLRFNFAKAAVHDEQCPAREKDAPKVLTIRPSVSGWQKRIWPDSCPALSRNPGNPTKTMLSTHL